MIVRITRHGDPIDTMSLACDDCRSMADPPTATAAPAVTANPAARPASAGNSRRHWRRHPRPARSTTARARPSPTRAIVTLTANPSPTRTPASAARGAEGSTPGGPDITATAATPNTTAWLSTCAPATSTWSSSGLAAHSRAARSCHAGRSRVIQCSSSAVPAKAARLARPSTNTVSRTEVPPASEASAWIAVASGP